MLIKALLLRGQKEMMNMLSETGRKGTLVVSAESFAELCPKVTWKAELVRSELEYLAKIFKQNIEVAACFLLLTIEFKGKTSELKFSLVFINLKLANIYSLSCFLLDTIHLFS